MNQPSASTPPARLSVSDSDYRPEIGCRIVVFLDGQEVQHCFGYDAVAGTVERARLDEGGSTCLDGDEVAMETLAGTVEPRWRDAEVSHG